jgi:septal ring factor EnvC (AmiA/AmiB activator)
MRTYLTNRIVELRRLSREDGHLQYLFRTREAQRALDRLNEIETGPVVAGQELQLKARIVNLETTLGNVKKELFERDTVLAALRKRLNESEAEVAKLKDKAMAKRDATSSSVIVVHRDKNGVVIDTEEVPTIKPNPWTGL